MHTASAIEWIFCRLTTKERAAAMVGDLLETGKEKGKLWFWLSVFGVALSLFWQRPLAFFVALFATWSVPVFFISRDLIFHLKHDHPGKWQIEFILYFFTVVGILCGLSLYAAIRYGLRERTTQMALVWSAICAVAAYFWWQPFVLEVCMAVAICIVVASMWTSKRRTESAVILIPAAIIFLCTPLWTSWSPQEMEKHPWLWGVGEIVSILSFWAATSAWSYMRDRQLRRTLLESSSEML